jgi:NAD(P)-dependent dehydrogenase (short-subunit alcohol dehydrogenase family)
MENVMENLRGKRAIITGGIQGLGLAIVEALTAQDVKVVAIARDRTKFTAAEKTGARMIAGDATDGNLMNRLVAEEQPDILVLNAGARLPMKAIDQQSWDEFSVVWNTDVKAGLIGIQAALSTPMRPGGRVLVVSSGAAMVMAVPYIAPEGLRLSGGYVGAKRMLWFMAHQANTVSKERGLGVRFQVIVPAQLMPDTELGHAVAQAYGRVEGVSARQHVLQRYGSILSPAEVGCRVAELLSNSQPAGVAFGVRAGMPLVPLDIPAQA